MDDSNMDMDNMSSLRPQTYLFGCELKADKDYLFKVNDEENEHQLSLRTVSLGAGAKDEFHVVEIEAMNYEGKQITVPVATLKLSVQPTVSLGGFEVTPPVTLRLKCGSGPVHVSGQHLVAMEDLESEEDEDEETMVPKNIKKRAANLAMSKVPQKKAKFSKNEDEDDDEDDEDEDDEDEDEEEDEEDDDDDEEEEEEEEGKTPTKTFRDTSAKKTPKSNQNGKDAKLLAAKVKTLDPPKGKRPPPPKTPPKSFTVEEIKAKMTASIQKGATLPKTEGKFENYVKNCFRADDKKVIKDLWLWRQTL